jgi:hypothetical protein
MNAKKAIGLGAVVLFTMFFAVPTIEAISHSSIFTTVNLSLQQPVHEPSGTRLISISTDGLVTIRIGSDSTFTARVGYEFRGARDRAPAIPWTLVSVNPKKDAVVIRYEDRVYLLPPGFRPGFIESPYAPGKGYIDVRGIPAGTVIRCPYTGRTFRVR